MFIDINFPDFAPDTAFLNANATDKVLNVFPMQFGYTPIKGFSQIGTPLPSQPFGMISGITSRGNPFCFIGTGTDIYRLRGSDFTWENVTRIDKDKKKIPYNANDVSIWSFVVFQDFVIAVNQNDAPQIIHIDTEFQFSDIKDDREGNAAPPRARSVTVWGAFVVLIGLHNDGKSGENSLMWSGVADPFWWQVGKKLCDVNFFPEGGKIVGASQAENPVVFMENAIYFGVFLQGDSNAFRFQKSLTDIGAKADRSIVTKGGLTFFVSNNGVFQIDNARNITNIGLDKVNSSMVNQLSIHEISQIVTVADPFFPRIYFLVRINASRSDGQYIFNTVFVYDYSLQKWSYFKCDLFLMGTFFSEGVTLKGLDNYSRTLEGLPYSLDSKFWQGGAPQLIGVDASLMAGSLAADNMEAILKTSEFGGIEPKRLTSIGIKGDIEEGYISVGYRNSLNENITWLPEERPSCRGRRTVKRIRARYFTLQLRIPAGQVWKSVQGLNLDLQDAGRL